MVRLANCSKNGPRPLQAKGATTWVGRSSFTEQYAEGKSLRETCPVRRPTAVVDREAAGHPEIVSLSGARALDGKRNLGRAGVTSERASVSSTLAGSGARHDRLLTAGPELGRQDAVVGQCPLDVHDAVAARVSGFNMEDVLQKLQEGSGSK